MRGYTWLRLTGQKIGRGDLNVVGNYELLGG